MSDFILYDYAGHKLFPASLPPNPEPSKPIEASPNASPSGLGEGVHDLRAEGLSINQRRFLAVFRERGSALHAARACQMSRTNHYNWLRDSELYREAFKVVETEAVRILEDEAYRRAIEGERKAVYYKGKIVGYETERSDYLLSKLLTARKPEVFSQRMNLRHAGPDGEKLEGMAAFDQVIAQARVELGEAEARLGSDEPTDD